MKSDKLWLSLGMSIKMFFQMLCRLSCLLGCIFVKIKMDSFYTLSSPMIVVLIPKKQGLKENSQSWKG